MTQGAKLRRARGFCYRGVILLSVLLSGYVSAQRCLAQSNAGESGGNRPAAQKAPAAPSQIDENQLVGLPLNGRSYNQLATLQAGVADTSAANASRGTGGGNLTISGSRPTSNNFLL